MSSTSSRSQLAWSLSYLRPYRRGAIALIVLSAAEIALRVFAPWSFAAVVDHALGKTPMSGWQRAVVDAIPSVSPDRRDHLLLTFVLVGLVIQLLHQLVLLVHTRLSATTGARLVQDLRGQLFGHLQRLELIHHAQTPTGDSVHRLETDVRCLEQIVLRGVFPLVCSAVTLVVMFGVLATIHLQLTLVAMSIVPPLYLWLSFYQRRLGPRADEARKLDSRLTARLHEAFSKIGLIKSHGREDHEQERFDGAAGDAAQAWIGVGQAGALFSIVVGFLTVIGASVVLLIGGLAVLRGGLTLGTLLLVLTYLGFVYGPLASIATTSRDLHQAYASARRVRAALAIVPEPVDPPDAIDATTIEGRVRFDGVAFAYRRDHRVLDGIDFEARPGELVALVGPSGAGKSTLASLIVGLHRPCAGEITIDGVPIERYRSSSLRRRIALVLPEAVMMAGSIRDNLRYGRPEASDAEVEAAARAAGAHDFIVALPQGYDTELGEAGAGLAAGQRQRLSIARAFLKDASVQVLDEPTAALDALSEARLVDTLRALSARRTTFVIAHRLSTARAADQILVLDHGRIVDRGTHAQLLRSSALYRRLAAQLSTPPAPEAAPDPVAWVPAGALSRGGA